VSIELAWAAGFYDGEGCTTLKNCGKNRSYPGYVRWYPRVAISQNDDFVLLRFQDAVGGVGTVRGPRWSPSMKNSKPRYVFETTGSGAVAVLQLLWPYLSPQKQEQAKGVLNDDRRAEASRVNG